MNQAFNLTVSPTAAAELLRQSLFAGTPGLMNIDLVEDSWSEGWMHIRLCPGTQDGVPISRTDGITLFARSDQLKMLMGLKLNYYGDLSGGGFLITTPEGAHGCACGAGFKMKA